MSLFHYFLYQAVMLAFTAGDAILYLMKFPAPFDFLLCRY